MSAIVMLSHHSVESPCLGHVTPKETFGLSPSAYYPVLPPRDTLLFSCPRDAVNHDGC